MTDFEKVYKEYFKDVYLYLLKLSGSEHIAEEITSECFFKAMQSINKFRGDCEVRVWLCQIAKNCYFNYIKKESKKADFGETFDFGSKEDSPELLSEKRNEAERIRKELHNLENPYKEVFMWRVFGELSFKEIGFIFKKTENWACVTYHRAKNMIKERMEEKVHETKL